ncbi:MAG: transglycosylase SLT domain-containing protein [Methylophilaceae bacterium]
MQFYKIFFTVILLAFSSQSFALTDEALFQHARAAYAAKNAPILAEDANQLQIQQYLLAPYAAYWQMTLGLEQQQVSDEEVQSFLAQYAEMPFTDKVRGEWLKKLAKDQNWTPFFAELERFQREDIAVQCYAMQGHLQLNDADVTAQAKALWLNSLDLAPNCWAVFDRLQLAGKLSNDNIWARFRLALQAGKLSVAKAAIARLPGFDTGNYKLLDRAYQSPKLFIDSKLASFKTRFGAEVNLYAIDRLARQKLVNAISTYEQVQNQFEADNRAFAWGRIGYHAARSHHPQAVSYYDLAEGTKLDDEQREWQVRAALRDQDWQTVLSAINEMPEKMLEKGAWRYWKARAIMVVEANNPVKNAEAGQILSKLSTERHFYGWLAQDLMGAVAANPAIDFVPKKSEIDAVASLPSIKRALELQRLDMRSEAKSEWIWATKNFSDEQLLAASAYAQQNKWYEMSINTADNTKVTHNFNLRYPIPYREMFRTSANNAGLDEAWVYGITRQESRFMHYAKSGVGAAGLMQLMPATAKWTANRMGKTGYSNAMIHDLSTNIDLGTYYMRYTLDQMGGKAVLATAGYNAGPNRAKNWMATKPLEAAIYIESIPFNETRGYVQKVMANTRMYAPRLTNDKLASKLPTLTERLGTIPGTGLPEVIDIEAQ